MLFFPLGLKRCGLFLSFRGPYNCVVGFGWTILCLFIGPLFACFYSINMLCYRVYSVSVFICCRDLFPSWIFKCYPDNQLKLLCHLSSSCPAAELPPLYRSVQAHNKTKPLRRYRKHFLSLIWKVFESVWNDANMLLFLLLSPFS